MVFPMNLKKLAWFNFKTDQRHFNKNCTIIKTVMSTETKQIITLQTADKNITNCKTVYG